MAAPQIKEYAFGHIQVDGQEYTRDLIITPEGIHDQWWRDEGHSLNMDDLQAAIDANPEVIVIGQGRYGRMTVPGQVREELEDAGIEVVVESTDEAWRTYNHLREERRAVAALHLTC